MVTRANKTRRPMIVSVITGLIGLSLLLSVTACSKKPEASSSKAGETKTAEQTKIEKAASDKVVRDNPVYGDQVKALDAVKEATKAAEAQAAETAKKIDDATK